MLVSHLITECCREILCVDYLAMEGATLVYEGLLYITVLPHCHLDPHELQLRVGRWPGAEAGAPA